jgi:Zn-dependent membrane protease YugP
MTSIGFIYFGLPLPFYIATAIGMALSLWATARVKGSFAKYSRVGVRSGMTGAQAAAAVARAGGALDVSIEKHQGFLSDHYDPRAKALRLSPEVHDGKSISAIAVAAHEAGHAIQDVEAYGPLVFRSKMVPVASIGNNIWPILIMMGFFFQATQLYNVGIILFSAVVVFQLVTLPVEFDASKRAKLVLADSGIVSTQEEAQGVEKVLGAAAMTYVAAALTSVLQLAALILARRD